MTRRVRSDRLRVLAIARSVLASRDTRRRHYGSPGSGCVPPGRRSGRPALSGLLRFLGACVTRRGLSSNCSTRRSGGAIGPSRPPSGGVRGGKAAPHPTTGLIKKSKIPYSLGLGAVQILLLILVELLESLRKFVRARRFAGG